jgi:spermidine/putrescine transport system substrate-binding protein
MKFHVLLLGCISIVALMLIGACSSDDTQELGAELHFLNWEDYVDPAILEGFEEEYGVTVVLHLFEDEPELVSRVTAESGSFDLFVGSGTVVGEMAEGRLLAPLDKSQIPNLENIAPEFLDHSWDRGNRYSAPYDWGSTGILYNSDMVTPEELSWSFLSDPEVAAHSVVDSDFSVVLGLALKSLGYSLKSDDDAELAEAVEVVSQQVRAGIEINNWWDVDDRVISGDLWATHAFTGDASVAIAENPHLAFFIPNEGSDLYFDVFAIPRDAPNKRAAELFINYVLDAETHAVATDYTGYSNPNAESARLGLVSAAGDDPVAVELRASTERLEAWSVFGDAQYSKWNRAWAEVLASRETSAAR